ncbi:MAG: monovalent cation/H(+) antiporter subunit G [Myxococcales bacterium]|nr:monovalent cation/H(+) antiporter subunit G [Myxococcales bacterium]
MGILEIIGTICMAIGCVFALTGSIGVLRMPDFYSRLHPAGKSDTLAQAMIIMGLVFFVGQQILDVMLSEGEGHGDQYVALGNILLKLILLSALLFLTAPTSTHAISKAARLDRFTQIPVEEDPGASTIGQIPVAGDVHEPMAEEPKPDVFDHQDPDEPQGQEKGER